MSDTAESIAQEQPPFEAYFVLEADYEPDRDTPLHTFLSGPYPSKEDAEDEITRNREAWASALEEWEDGSPYEFKTWQVERVLLRDFMMERLQREDRESFEARREAANALGASMLVEEGIISEEVLDDV